MISRRHLADKFGSAPHEECICQRAKDEELFIKSILGHDFLIRNNHIFEFLHVETSLSKIELKSLFTAVKPLIDTFVTRS